MLSERQRELLTAYLDGQLRPRHQKAALRLLHQSSEARTLLRQLQEDAHGLRGLPRRALPADFAQKVLQTASDRGLRPGAGRAPRPSGVPAWAGLAAAAAVLLAVTAGSFLYFREAQAPGEMAALGPFDLPTPPRTVPGEEIPLPRTPLALGDFGRKEVRTRLAADLRKRPAHRLDLETGHTSRLVERLTGAFEANHIRVLIAPPARESLKKKHPRVTYVVYAENLRPEELTAVLVLLGTASGAGPKAGPDGLLIDPMSAEDRGHLSRLLGVSPDELQSPKTPRPPIRELPIHDPEGKPEKEPKQAIPAPKAPDRFAVVLHAEGGNSSASVEVRRFLSSRRAHRPGTVQVYLVVQEASA
jgi:hypothetical protein